MIAALETGQQVVLTDTETNKGDLAKAIVEAGFIVGPGVSKKTSLLVAGNPDGETSKARKARDYGIPIMGEQEFIDQFLGGSVAPDVDIPAYPVPEDPDQLAYPAKRSPAAMKQVISGLRDGLELVVHLADDVVLAGPCRYSPLAEGWMVAGVQIASRTTAEKQVLAIHLAQGRFAGTPLGLDEITPGDAVAAQYSSAPYGTFTVAGRIEESNGIRFVGPWILQVNERLHGVRSLGPVTETASIQASAPAIAADQAHVCEEDWFGDCYTCGANML